ncbi:hypothetical protein Athai_54350 [Actinocatenispora thailandica]|uniref:Uncharacterized protein n=1 Tax=Actinocatenispora thailandica TaxID=227318 RepID=A0A7R7DU83_9ACTN|nr:hypothetical protein [Actinocatenispora thailandica]BCJ37932.1 hypothetical protein Athai_54350 [Actinocatenispora thailandica]
MTAADMWAARLWRLRVPDVRTKGTAVTVRLDANETDARIWLAVGSGHRRMPLTLPEAWAVLKLLAEAVDFTGDPPPFVARTVTPTTK